MLTVDTPLGTLRASEADYYDHPGIWIEIQRRGQDDFCPLALVEYTDGEDEKAADETILTRVWKDPEDDDVTTIVHENTTGPRGRIGVNRSGKKHRTLITEMGLPEREISRIISGYRKLIKVAHQLTGETESPWWSVTAFIEELLPAFAETMQGGNTTERYHELLAMVLSDMEESELEKVLLMAAGSNVDRDVEKNAT